MKTLIKRLAGILLLLAIIIATGCRDSQQLVITQENKMQHWRDATFGMFIHWGAYSHLAGIWDGQVVQGYAEHIFRSHQIPLEEYKEKVVKQFNPVEFDAEEWVQIAKAAGMKYLVITAKHHDGFAMWDSKITDYDIIDMTPFDRDPMRELRDACKKNDVLFGFYYSHSQDWSHRYGQRNQWDFDHPQPSVRNWFRNPEWDHYIEKSWIYVREKSIPQLKELISGYDPDILWFDTHNWLPLELTKEIVKVAQTMKPELIINSRGTRGIKDYQCTNDKPIDFPPRSEKYWEAIPTTNESYGYHSKDLSHKPSPYFIKLISKAAAQGGNLLMNVGPMGNGKIDPIDVGILKGIGDWLKVNGEAIYGVQKSDLPIPAWGVSSIQGNKLYLHVLQWPEDQKLIVGGLKSEVNNAYFLEDPNKTKIEYKRLNELDLVLKVPAKAPDTVNTVVVVECKDEIKTDPVRLIATNVADNRFHVFEGLLDGENIKFGSGNEKDNYIKVWKDEESFVSWKIRVSRTSEFKLNITYSADEKMTGNIFEVIIGDKRIKKVVQPGRYKEYSLGKLTLEPGIYNMEVRPVKIKKNDLMYLTKLNLVSL